MKNWALMALLALLIGTGCNLSDDARPSVGNNSENDGGAGTDAGASDGGADAGGEDACTPAVCEADACGMVTDGCGGMLDCGPCGCREDALEECAEMPCMTVVGCATDGSCEYEAVSCGGNLCECEDPDNCTDEELRWCRDADALTCPADACEPDPTIEADGSVSYANTCVQPDGALCDYVDICVQGACAGTECLPQECGQCGLGGWDCNEAGDRTCFDIPESATPVDSLNCNDRSPDSTFLYVDDSTGTDSAGSGSRDQPFETLTAALTAAQNRGATGVIVKSGYVHTGRLDLLDGVSIYSGYSGSPDWERDEGYLRVEGGAIGVEAKDITVRTVLHRLQIQAASPSAAGQSSYGIRGISAKALVLDDVQVRAATGASGATGRTGAPGQSGINAPFPTPSGGTPGKNPACSSADGGVGGRGGQPGDRGVDGQTSPGGFRGGQGGLPRSAGGPGQKATAGQTGAHGDGGVRGFQIVDGEWIPDGKGASGAAGEDGLGGGGGGGGGGTPPGFLIRNSGGSGGGGGAGGCGGNGGEGGSPGGGSFGIFLVDSTGIEIVKTVVNAGDGGPGGRGGSGGDGGTPGAASIGAPPPGPETGNGGPGGAGSFGGDGGNGGGGAGGDSVAVFCHMTSATLDDATLAAGSPGPGGAAPNPGQDGIAAPSVGCDGSMR